MWKSDRGTHTVSVVMAAVNESTTVAEVISGVNRLGIVDKIILVDDGSNDDTGSIARKEGCQVLRNESRIGQTRSIKRGIEAAETDLVITMDADMDHIPEDILRLLQTMEQTQADIVVGRRSQLPRISEKIVSTIVSRTTGVIDTLSGFRLISKNALDRVAFDDDNTWGTLFLIRCAKKKLRLAEVSIQTSPPRRVTRTGGRFQSNAKILKALWKDILCIAGVI